MRLFYKKGVYGGETEGREAPRLCGAGSFPISIPKRSRQMPLAEFPGLVTARNVDGRHSRM